MSQLPLFKSDDQSLSLLQTKWKSVLDPVLAIPILGGVQLKSISLKAGETVINHLLGRMQQGWFLTDQNASASIYRSKPLNDKTLSLTSSAAVIVSLWVY